MFLDEALERVRGQATVEFEGTKLDFAAFADDQVVFADIDVKLAKKTRVIGAELDSMGMSVNQNNGDAANMDGFQTVFRRKKKGGFRKPHNDRPRR